MAISHDPNISLETFIGGLSQGLQSGLRTTMSLANMIYQMQMRRWMLNMQMERANAYKKYLESRAKYEDISGQAKLQSLPYEIANKAIINSLLIPKYNIEAQRANAYSTRQKAYSNWYNTRAVLARNLYPATLLGTLGKGMKAFSTGAQNIADTTGQPVSTQVLQQAINAYSSNNAPIYSQTQNNVPQVNLPQVNIAPTTQIPIQTPNQGITQQTPQETPQETPQVGTPSKGYIYPTGYVKPTKEFVTSLQQGYQTIDPKVVAGLATSLARLYKNNPKGVKDYNQSLHNYLSGIVTSSQDMYKRLQGSIKTKTDYDKALQRTFFDIMKEARLQAAKEAGLDTTPITKWSALQTQTFRRIYLNTLKGYQQTLGNMVTDPTMRTAISKNIQTMIKASLMGNFNKLYMLQDNATKMANILGDYYNKNIDQKTALNKINKATGYGFTNMDDVVLTATALHKLIGAAFIAPTPSSSGKGGTTQSNNPKTTFNQTAKQVLQDAQKKGSKKSVGIIRGLIKTFSSWFGRKK